MNYIANLFYLTKENHSRTDYQALDTLIQRAMNQDSVPGLAALIIAQDQVLLAKGYGLANLELNVPVTAQTMFQSGSLGKMFTAAGIMALVEEGTIALEDSISKYLTEGPQTWKNITIRHLLTHTSGIPDYDSTCLDYQKDYRDGDLIVFAANLPLGFPPGTQWNYSNTGYVLLGIIITRLTQKAYWEYLREKIWKPSEMHDIQINDVQKIIPHRASGYIVQDDPSPLPSPSLSPSPSSSSSLPSPSLSPLPSPRYSNQNWVSSTMNTTADGSLLMNLSDLIAWNGVVRSRAVLSRQSWHEIFSPVQLKNGQTYPYGFGWYTNKIGDSLVYEHSGGWQGFQTYFRRYENHDLTFAILTNCDRADPGKIIDRIANIFNPKLCTSLKLKYLTNNLTDSHQDESQSD